jgi:ribonuclease E
MERPIIDRPYNQPPASAAEPQPAPQAAVPAEPEPPRRRSTIREPAPIGSAGAPPPPAPVIPPPTPVISSTASDDTGQPKRGWWAKRLLGDK